MPFQIFLDANIWFTEKKLIQRSYITIKALLTTKKVELIDKKKFATLIKDENFKIFVIYIATLEAQLLILVHLIRKAQILAL